MSLVLGSTFSACEIDAVDALRGEADLYSFVVCIYLIIQFNLITTLIFCILSSYTPSNLHPPLAISISTILLSLNSFPKSSNSLVLILPSMIIHGIHQMPINSRKPSQTATYWKIKMGIFLRVSLYKLVMISATINSMKENRSSQKRITKIQQNRQNEEDSDEFNPPSDEDSNQIVSEQKYSSQTNKNNFNNVGKNLCAFINRKTDKRSLNLNELQGHIYDLLPKRSSKKESYSKQTLKQIFEKPDKTLQRLNKRGEIHLQNTPGNLKKVARAQQHLRLQVKKQLQILDLEKQTNEMEVRNKHEMRITIEKFIDELGSGNIAPKLKKHHQEKYQEIINQKKKQKRQINEILEDMMEEREEFPQQEERRNEKRKKSSEKIKSSEKRRRLSELKREEKRMEEEEQDQRIMRDIFLEDFMGDSE